MNSIKGILSLDNSEPNKLPTPEQLKALKDISFDTSDVPYIQTVHQEIQVSFEMPPKFIEKVVEKPRSPSASPKGFIKQKKAKKESSGLEAKTKRDTSQKKSRKMSNVQ